MEVIPCHNKTYSAWQTPGTRFMQIKSLSMLDHDATTVQEQVWFTIISDAFTSKHIPTIIIDQPPRTFAQTNKIEPARHDRPPL